MFWILCDVMYYGGTHAFVVECLNDIKCGRAWVLDQGPMPLCNDAEDY